MKIIGRAYLEKLATKRLIGVAYLEKLAYDPLGLEKKPDNIDNHRPGPYAVMPRKSYDPVRIQQENRQHHTPSNKINTDPSGLKVQDGGLYTNEQERKAYQDYLANELANSTCNDSGWDLYRKYYNPVWQTAKSTEDNLRGYAETVGEVGGGAVGTGLGLLGSSATGPAAPVAAPTLAVAGGYTGGKMGREGARNVFNYVNNLWNGTPEQPTDGFGRPTGYSFKPNLLHPQIADGGYFLGGVGGGALRTDVNQLGNHFRNLAGRPLVNTAATPSRMFANAGGTLTMPAQPAQSATQTFSPIYQRLPWMQRYNYGPSAKLRAEADYTRPTQFGDLMSWRTADLGSGQYFGATRTNPELLDSNMNLSWQALRANQMTNPNLTKAENDLLRQRQKNPNVIEALTDLGYPPDSAKRFVQNGGEIADYYNFSNNHTLTPGSSDYSPVGKQRHTLPRSFDDGKIWQPLDTVGTGIKNNKLREVRFLSNEQAAPVSLTGSHTINGKLQPISVTDGFAPTSVGTGAEAYAAELARRPNHPLLKKTYDLMQKFEPDGEVTVPRSATSDDIYFWTKPFDSEWSAAEQAVVYPGRYMADESPKAIKNLMPLISGGLATQSLLHEP
jgi:hypothetical protein